MWGYWTNTVNPQVFWVSFFQNCIYFFQAFCAFRVYMCVA